MTEKEIVTKFNSLCESSLEPDKYSFLMDEILPALVATRKALKSSNIDWSNVENEDGKLVLHSTGKDGASRYLTDEECADYIWGTDILEEKVSVETATGETFSD